MRKTGNVVQLICDRLLHVRTCSCKTLPVEPWPRPERPRRDGREGFTRRRRSDVRPDDRVELPGCPRGAPGSLRIPPVALEAPGVPRRVPGANRIKTGGGAGGGRARTGMFSFCCWRPGYPGDAHMLVRGGIPGAAGPGLARARDAFGSRPGRALGRPGARHPGPGRFSGFGLLGIVRRRPQSLLLSAAYGSKRLLAGT